MTSDFDELTRRLSTEMKESVRGVVAPPGGREAIDRQIGRRARRRRHRGIGMGVVAVVAVVGLLAGALALRSDDSVGVSTQPQGLGGQMPLLAPPTSPWWVASVSDTMYDLDVSSDGEQYRFRVQVLMPNLPSLLADLGPGQVWRTVGDQKAIVDVFGPSPGIYWQPTPTTLASLNESVVTRVGDGLGRPHPDDGRQTPSTALLDPATTTSQPPTTPSTAETPLDPDERASADGLVRLANTFAPVDDATWWRALTPQPGDTPPPNLAFPGIPLRIGLPADVATSTFGQYSPWQAIETQLDVVGFSPDTFTLVSSTVPVMGVTTDGQSVEPITVRGLSGEAVDVSPGAAYSPLGASMIMAPHEIRWSEGGSTIELAFTDGATRAQALELATKLRVLDDDEWHAIFTGTQEAPSPSSTTPAPATPAYDGEGRDSPLVGLSEREVSLRYPFVRVVWGDGSSSIVTADGRAGRVDLAVSDGVIVGATIEGCGPGSQADYCNPTESDGPDAIGTLQVEDGVVRLHANGRSDVELTGLQDINTRDLALRLVEPADLRSGDRVRVWFIGACAQESLPVCGVEGLVVERD